MADFVDDPRSAVQAATDRVENEISEFVAELREHLAKLPDSSPGQSAAPTEEMRQILLSYREVSTHLAENRRSLTRTG